MPNFAVIENGKVVNAVVSDADFAAENGWVELTSGGIGWDYIDGVFVDNRPVAVEPVPVPAPTKEPAVADDVPAAYCVERHVPFAVVLPIR
jgi:hypothetical protein